jgi:hypothetical protein
MALMILICLGLIFADIPMREPPLGTAHTGALIFLLLNSPNEVDVSRNGTDTSWSLWICTYAECRWDGNCEMLLGTYGEGCRNLSGLKFNCKMIFRSHGTVDELEFEMSQWRALIWHWQWMRRRLFTIPLALTCEDHNAGVLTTLSSFGIRHRNDPLSSLAIYVDERWRSQDHLNDAKIIIKSMDLVASVWWTGHTAIEH